MSELSDAGRQSGRAKVRFATTIWDRVLEAGNEQSSDSAAALEALCQQYWPPVYAYLRRKGHCPDEARDLTQASSLSGSRITPSRGPIRPGAVSAIS
jgi:hypothetical protein